MIRILTILTGLLATMNTFAADPQYPVSAIPAGLLKDAIAVQREEVLTVKIVDTRDVRMVHRVVVTILNENGDKFGGLSEGYDKYREIKDISGVLYDSQGNQLRKLKQSEIRDGSAVSDNNLMDDNRIKTHHFYHKVYPYTVAYEVEYRHRFTASLPNWVPQGGYQYAVEQSRLEVSVPEDYDLRYRQYRYIGEPAKRTEKGSKVLTWEVKNLPALTKEQFTGPWREQTTVVYLAPSRFSFAAYDGSMSTWEDFARFQNVLNEGRGVLPDNIKAVVAKTIAGATTDADKIRLLYNYMQQNTRYISIQLGIGGWQPFDAAYVAAKGYGDCKALSNYMKALLAEAGIRSHYTLVKAGEGANDFIEDFTVDQFNHIILCVPGIKDTTWLECTSQTAPAGYLGSFTNDRPVLLVTETGGKLVRTPIYTAAQNLQLRNIVAEADEAGNLKVACKTKYTGLQQDDYHSLMSYLSKEKQLEYVKGRLSLPSFDIRQLDYKARPDAWPVPEIEESLDLTVPNYASVTGKRLFITPNILNRHQGKLTAESARKSDIYIRTPYRDADTVEIAVPAGYQPEAMFPEVKLSTRFGSYYAKVTVEGNKIRYIRQVEMKAGRYPAAEYPALEDFLNQMYKSDRSRVVLVKKEAS
ncbi:DUF3857 domain-containing protein [Chitinophaga deserti]|uniref:DUF3857 domain-containing protein n=1 Tax=Chitinophaga deserti TaxID=2164099 RepID=UPI000D6D2F3E|nr:DUF3857 domain-containing protein [Chitinophaga deserti]